jgi:transposase
VRQRTAAVNSARGLLGEFGLVASKGIRHVGELRRSLEEACESVLPHEARSALTALFDHLDALTVKLDTVDQEILAWHKTSKESQHLATAPGVGPLTATALVAAIGDGTQFQSARHFAAWLGLTPRISASGGREHIGRISKGGDRYLRTLLIHGARAMVGTMFRRKVKPRPWLRALMARRPINVAAVAVAHKTARALWAMLRRGEAYRRPASLEVAA